jgi:hypothetical protein
MSALAHNEAQLRAFYRLRSPLLPFEVAALVPEVRALAAKRGALPEVVALAGRLHILTDDDLRALYAQPVTGTHPHAKPAHKPRDWSAE